MKPVKLLVSTFLLLFFYTSQAQHHSLTVLGGLNVANMSAFVDGANIEDTYKMKMAFHAAVFYDHVLTKDRHKELSIESGLIFDVKGVKQDLEIGENTQERAWNLYYADIPVYFKYSKKLRSRDKIYGGIGPYFGVGLFGTWDKGESDESIEWGSDASNDHLKRLDYGLSAKVGYYSYGGLNVSASYDYGLPNITTAADLPEFKHRVLRLSVGYSFKFND